MHAMSDLFMNMQHRDQWRRATAPGRSSSERSAPQSTTATHGSSMTMDDGSVDGGVGGAFANLLKLQLRKPKNWKWELNMSRSCNNIALPRILLFDYKGDLLVDAPGGDEECCYRQDDLSSPPQKRTQSRSPSAAVTPSSSTPSTRSSRRSSRAATANLAHSIQLALDRELNGLQIAEATPSPPILNGQKPPSLRRPSSLASSSSPLSMVSGMSGVSGIDFFTNDLPDCRRPSNGHSQGSGSSSMRSVRFRDASSKNSTASFNGGLPTPPYTNTPTPTNGTPATTTTTGSSSSGPREKRRYRRSRSSGRSPSSAATSDSILERFSYSRGRFSSPDTADETDLPTPPRYFLRTSNAGTLMVRDESFSQCRRRGKPRSASSSDSLNANGLLSPPKSRSRSASLLRATEASIDGSHRAGSGNSLQDISESPERNGCELPLPPPAEPWRKSRAVDRRHRSDGNMLLLAKQLQREREQQQQVEEEVAEGRSCVQDRPMATPNCGIQQRRYATYRRQSKKELPTIDSGNEAIPQSRPDRTAR